MRCQHHTSPVAGGTNRCPTRAAFVMMTSYATPAPVTIYVCSTHAQALLDLGWSRVLNPTTDDLDILEITL